jgi:hypothetical protein
MIAKKDWSLDLDGLSRFHPPPPPEHENMGLKYHLSVSVYACR